MLFVFVSLRKMPVPCSGDLRWQIIWLVLEMRKSTQEAAVLVGVTQRTIFNILCRFHRNSTVRPCRIGSPNVVAIL